MKKTLIFSWFALAGLFLVYSATAQDVTKRYNDVTIKEAFKMMKDPNIVILDVRSPEEFTNTSSYLNISKIKRAINIPVDELSSHLDRLEKYKNRKIIVYCSHAQRSVVASKFLSSHGFNSVYNMLGGLTRVKDASTNDLPNKNEFYIP